MKKRVLFRKIHFYIIFLIMVFINPLCVNAEALTYSEAINMVKEVMKQYYVRGPYFQYNYAKAVYYNLPPEDGTLQDNKYTVCAGFTHNVYNQAFGIEGPNTYMSGDNKFKESAFPKYNYHIAYAGQHAYQKIKDKKIADDGNVLLYYQCNVNTTDPKKNDGHVRDREKVKYVYGDTDTSSDIGDFETLVKNVQPGDLVVYSGAEAGHALIVYDSVDTNGDGKKDDVLILNATGGGNEIFSRIASTSSLYYSAFRSSSKGTEFLDLEKEGLFQLTLLSSQSRFVSNGVLKCKSSNTDECAIVRPFYKDSNGNAVFNFRQEINKSSTAVKKSAIRTKYTGLMIEKTVSKGDNNSVYIDDELTYTINVANKSYVAKDNKTYGQFTISETIDSNVQCVDCTEQGWTVSGNTITKTITKKLAPGESVELNYTVKVKNNPSLVGNTITSVGSFYDTSGNKGILATGTVENLIIPKVKNLKESYSSCYSKNESKYSGLNLIDKVYYCATGKDFNFDTFDFSKMFVKTGTKKSNATINFVDFNDDANKSHMIFSKMILNKYFGGLSKSDTDYFLPRHSSKSAEHAETINSIDFKEGDVLIYNMYDSQYTYEEGIYAFMYIDNVFVGVNGDGYAVRNKFSPVYHTYDYWKDNGFDKSLTVANSLYKTDWSSLSSTERKFVHYQTLFDKDNYVILRPELVIKEIAAVEGVSMPTKTTYIQNYENLDLAGGKLKILYNDGTSETISMSASGVTVSGFDNTETGPNTIYVTYKGFNVGFNVTIVPKSITKLEVVSSPTKTTYIQNYENLNLGGGKIKATYNDTSTETINMTNSNVTVSGFSNTKTDTITLTVSYKGKNTTFNVTIVPKSITKLEVVSLPTKTSYFQNKETLNLSGGKIKATYNDTSTETIDMTNSNVTVSGFSNTKADTITLTVSYKGKSTTFNVTIVPMSITKIEVYAKPTKITYIQNKETLDLSGGRIKVTYNDSSTELVSMTSSSVTVSGFSNTKVDTITLTVSYKGKTTTFVVTIVEQLNLKDSFTNKGFKFRNNFVHGFTLNESLVSIKNKVNVNFTYGNEGIIATGVQFKYSSEVLTAVVYGDLNGDGKINSADLLRMRQHLLETNLLSGAYKEAAMIADGETINSANLLRLRQHLLEQKLIVQ